MILFSLENLGPQEPKIWKKKIVVTYSILVYIYKE